MAMETKQLIPNSLRINFRQIMLRIQEEQEAQQGILMLPPLKHLSSIPLLQLQMQAQPNSITHSNSKRLQQVIRIKLHQRVRATRHNIMDLEHKIK